MARHREHHQLGTFPARQGEHEHECDGQRRRAEQKIGAEATQARPGPVGHGADQRVDRRVPDQRAHVDESRSVGREAQHFGVEEQQEQRCDLPVDIHPEVACTERNLPRQ
ncbi:hypothetical protein D3C84_945980 [compost metagenome]